ncbi:unnamed protein product [Malus baccata var. baccata]
MASTIAPAAATFVCSPSSTAGGTKAAKFRRKDPKFQLCSVVPPLGLSPFSPWIGLKQLGISLVPKSLKLERRGRCKGMVVYASLFGVGAPEALVIGVVALLVFGPKGLAEVARTLGKTLRAFQPTIRELQEVSRDFKSTLEKEIGLDDISSSSIDAFNGKKMDTTSTPSSTTTTGDSKTTIKDSKTTAEDSKTVDISSLSSIDAYNARIMGKTSTSSSTATTEDSKNTADTEQNRAKARASPVSGALCGPSTGAIETSFRTTPLKVVWEHMLLSTLPGTHKRSTLILLDGGG